MRPPTTDEIEKVKRLLQCSIHLLETTDRDLYASEMMEDAITYSSMHRAIDYKLHEVTINHRLAHYLENSLSDFGLKNYFVDIEYNRFHGGEKILAISGGSKVVRPDILVHGRRDERFSPQHYLVIEAKKGKPSQKDIDKVKSFLTDPNYHYLFGATISYFSNRTRVTCSLYYLDANQVVSHQTLA